MIATLKGQILVKTSTLVVLDVHGVGYEVFVSARSYENLPDAGGTAFLYVQTVVREDAITLFGFSTREEKELFLLLITVSGVGPRLAIMILSGIGVRELCQALQARDHARLTALPGIGKKTAQRLCMELGEKVGVFGGEIEKVGRPLPSAGDEGYQAMTDAASALVNLGYASATAWEALHTVRRQGQDEPDVPGVEELIRQALQRLARH
nr:Holliday junction branch migration protein RuvA [Desulfobulbus alkaliphilus]